MTVTLNGEKQDFTGTDITVKAMLDALRYSFPLIIVKVNGNLVSRPAYGNTRVTDGDSVEMYHLVSGG